MSKNMTNEQWVDYLKESSKQAYDEGRYEYAGELKVQADSLENNVNQLKGR